MAGIYWGNNACIGLAHSYCSTLTVFWDWYSWLLLFDSAFWALEGAGVVGFRFVMVVRGGRVVVCKGCGCLRGVVVCGEGEIGWGKDSRAVPKDDT